MAKKLDVHLITTQKYPEDRYCADVRIHEAVTFHGSGLSTDSLRFWEFRRLKRALEEADPDIVHFTGPHFWNMYLVRWLRHKHVKVVHTIHDTDPHHGVGYGRLLYVWNRAIIRWADHILVHGAVYRRRLMEAGIDSDRVTCTPLTHLFVSCAREQALNETEFTVEYEPIVLFFGRQEKYKGVDVLVRAFHRLRENLNNDGSYQSARLIVAGPGGDYRARYGDDCQDVEWRTHRIGDEEALDLFRRCSVVVLPYRDASQSAIVAAAYYFRKPVIVTAVGALPEYVEPEKTGLVIQGDDVESSLAEAMYRILRVDGYKESLGSGGRAWYDEQRAQETTRMEGLYRGLGN
jgi:glycosyltransferase involved in cell wall biosynthesis